MTKPTYPLSESDQALAADLAKKMMKTAGNQRPEILAGAALLVIQLIVLANDTSKGTK
jgi:hypothetical protein